MEDKILLYYTEPDNTFHYFDKEEESYLPEENFIGEAKHDFLDWFCNSEFIDSINTIDELRSKFFLKLNADNMLHETNNLNLN